jgi:hypothetical protein
MNAIEVGSLAGTRNAENSAFFIIPIKNVIGNECELG